MLVHAGEGLKNTLRGRLHSFPAFNESLAVGFQEELNNRQHLLINPFPSPAC